MKTKECAVSSIEAARALTQRGFYVVPIPSGNNHPVVDKWQNLRITLDDLEAHFADGDNVGILLAPSGLADVDLDCREAIAAADELLPKTAMVHGHLSSPRSHRYYLPTSIPKNKSFHDPRQDKAKSARAVIAELRVSGQTIAPPSINLRTGERVEFDCDGEPASVDGDALAAAVAKVAAAALLGRYWPQGARHFASLALAGMLLRVGWNDDNVTDFLDAVTSAAQDEESASRLHDVVTTAQRLDTEQPVTGARTLAELIGNDVITKVCEWLGLGTGNNEHNTAPRSRGGGLVKQLSDDISSAEQFAQDQSGELYRFNNGVYVPDGERHVKRLVKTLLEKRNETQVWSSNRAKEVVEYLRVDSPLLWERPPLDLINVKNGLLDVTTGELSPHSPEFLSTVQLPVVFDASAECPAWERFVADVFPKDAQQLAWDIPAWLMTPDTSIQKAILLVGEGANGKSVYLAALRTFLGRANVASESLHRLESNRFAVAQLVGKLANICPDLPSASLAGSSVFKLITGGDCITGECKFKQPFPFIPFARLVFSANHFPRSADASHAYFRRWIILPFERTFDPSDQIPREVLDAQLAAPSELSGLLNKALGAVAAIRTRGGLHEPESVCGAGMEFVRLTDPVAGWLNSITIQCPDEMVAKDVLLAEYNRTAVREGRPIITPTALGLGIKRFMPGINDAQRKVGGRRQWVWLGLGLRTPEFEA
jgi:P4 family phage/plasmid primase-like protien